MDVRMINPFLIATIDVLKTMARVEARPGKVYLKETSNAHGDVSGIIGITGDAIGSLAISFSEPCICHLMSAMLGEPCMEANQDVFDGVGEITNMISGVARTQMEKDGLEVYAAIPAVIYGKDHMINHILKSPSIVIPFVTDHGPFVVDVCIKKIDREVKRAEDYQVVNKRTLVAPPPPAAPSFAPALPPPGFAAPPSPAPSRSGPPSGDDAPEATAEHPLDRKELLKKKVQEITSIRDDMVKQLNEKPFMEIAKRQKFKKQIPVLESQIRRLKLDIQTVTMLSNLTSDDLENPKVVAHYQHYEQKKKP